MPRHSDDGTAARPSPAGLIRRDFPGAVLLKYFIPTPNGGNVQAVAGRVSILTAKEATGFEVSGTESNWVARVAGPRTSVTVPGCQVRAVFDLPAPFEVTNSDYWQVP